MTTTKTKSLSLTKFRKPALQVLLGAGTFQLLGFLSTFKLLELSTFILFGVWTAGVLCLGVGEWITAQRNFQGRTLSPVQVLSCFAGSLVLISLSFVFVLIGTWVGGF